MSSLPFPPRAPQGSTRLLAKTLLVGLLSLLLLIPLGMIQGTVRERQAYREQAVAAVAESFAGPQWLAGPVLSLDYVDEVDVVTRDAGPTVAARRPSPGRPETTAAGACGVARW